jgi:hypothetical protein
MYLSISSMVDLSVSSFTVVIKPSEEFDRLALLKYVPSSVGIILFSLLH